ncbi:hypothetical protein NC652_011221 [Populus alba x Populus x berolinensis]|nr:hypothetical protein NC652_011221 [Populus alba x Populus x berolinensis]
MKAVQGLQKKNTWPFFLKQGKLQFDLVSQARGKASSPRIRASSRELEKRYVDENRGMQELTPQSQTKSSYSFIYSSFFSYVMTEKTF